MHNFFNLFFNPLFFIVGGPLVVILYHTCVGRALTHPDRDVYHSTVFMWLYEQLRGISHTSHNTCSCDGCCEACKWLELQKRVDDLVAKNTLLEEQRTQLRFQLEHTTRDSKFYNIELEDALIRERNEHERFFQHRQSMANDLHEKERNRLVQQAAQQHLEHRKEKDFLNESIKNLTNENRRLKERVECLAKISGRVQKDPEVATTHEEANQDRNQIEILQGGKAYWKANYRQQKLTADTATEKIQNLETKNGELALRCRELHLQNDNLTIANKRECGKASRAREECVRLRCEISQLQHENARQSRMSVQINTPMDVI
jgi:hypothetical protein